MTLELFKNVTKIYNKLKHTNGGKNADYISELKRSIPIYMPYLFIPLTGKNIILVILIMRLQ